MKKILILIVTLFSFQHPSLSQDKHFIDSLLAKIQKAEEDTSKVNSLLALSSEFGKKNDFDKARQYADEALSLSQKIDFKKGKGKAYRIIGFIYKNQNNFIEAIKYYSFALEIWKEIMDNNRIPQTYFDLAELYGILGNYPEAINNLYASLKIVEQKGDKQKGDKSNMANIYNGLGVLYKDQGNYPEAMKNLSYALKIREEIGDKDGTTAILGNMAGIYKDQGNLPEALKNYQQALELSEQTGNKIFISLSFDNIGNVYADQGNYTEALNNHFAALKISEEINDKPHIACIYHNIGSRYVKTKKFKEAREYLNKSLVLSKTFGIKLGIKSCYETLAQLDSATGNYKAALENYKLFVIYRDSLVNEENTKKTVQQQMQYEFDKKEAVTQAEHEKKDAIAQKELQRQKWVRNGFICGFAAVLLFAVVFFRQRTKISKEKKISDAEKKRSEELLLNILPYEVSQELKQTGHCQAKTFSMVTVMFMDFKDFTTVSEMFSAELLVDEINTCFSAFDGIIQKYKIEKIKTVGDAYICASGLPTLNFTHAVEIVNAAIEIQKFMLAHKKEKEDKGEIAFEMRIGIHTGSVVAGIVGVKKFQYDIWGDTVNLAARMEQKSEAGKINISGSTHKLVKDKFNCVYRGKIDAKNKGEVEMYFIESIT